MIDYTDPQNVFTCPALGKVRLPPHQWISKVLSVSDASADFALTKVKTQKAEVNWDAAILLLHHLSKEDGNDRHFTEREIGNALHVWGLTEKEKALQRLRTLIAFTKPNNLVADFIFLITGQRNDLHVAQLGHWLWQVKRKMNDRQPDDDLMLVFSGETGGGKSRAIKNLLEPLSDVYSVTSAEIFDDKFAYQTFEDHFVIFLDELAKLSTTDVNKLKSLISNPTYSSRLMRQQVTRRWKINASIIGATNHPLNTVLNDETSARRYWDIPTLPAKKLQMNWDAINAFDYKALWQGVDETANSPHIELREKIRDTQEAELRPQGFLEEWAEMNVIPDQAEFTSTELLSECFMRWAREKNLRLTWTSDRFGKKLAALGTYARKQSKASGANIRGFAVKLRIDSGSMSTYGARA